MSRLPLQVKSLAIAPDLTQRWISTSVPEMKLGLSALYIPGVDSRTRLKSLAGKVQFWDSVIADANARRDTRHVFIGDLNTGAHHIEETRATFHCADRFDAPTACGLDRYLAARPRSRE